MAEQENTPKKKLGTGAKVAIGCGGITLLGIIIILIITIAGVAGVAKVVEEVEIQQTEQEVAEQETFDEPSQIGEVIVVDDVQWIVTEAKDLGSTLKSSYGAYGDDCVANSGTFIKVTIKIKNNSKEMVSVSDLYLYDSEEREFITSSDVYSCIEDELFIFDNINPGIEKTFVAVYEVPDDATDLKIKVGDLDFFSNEYKYVSLGL
ncbi:DUF4352 domain-containing protein [bacterium]|nr:DUF4352 domain-containing protein [bacterium]